MNILEILKACVPPIFSIVIRKFRMESESKLFDGDDALFKYETRKVDLYGEYGCGKSTNWVLRNTAANVIAVDTCLEWIASVRRHNEPNLVRLDIHHCDFGDLGKWGRPLSYKNIDSFSDYTDVLWKQKTTPELVLIDGRFRVCCFLTSLKYAEEGTKILFDDYTNRARYHFVEKYVSRFKECGRQCMFVVPPKAKINMVELDKDIASFRNVMD